MFLLDDERVRFKCSDEKENVYIHVGGTVENLLNMIHVLIQFEWTDIEILDFIVDVMVLGPGILHHFLCQLSLLVTRWRMGEIIIFHP